MVLPHHLILLQIPTFHLLVFSTWKEIGMSIWDCQAPHRVNVPCECHEQLPFNQVPKLDGPIVGPCHEKSILGVNCDTAHPPIVPANDRFEFPGRVPLWFNYFALSQNQLGPILAESVIKTRLIFIICRVCCYQITWDTLNIGGLFFFLRLLFNFKQGFLSGHTHFATNFFSLFHFFCFLIINFVRVIGICLVKKARSWFYIYAFEKTASFCRTDFYARNFAQICVLWLYPCLYFRLSDLLEWLWCAAWLNIFDVFSFKHLESSFSILDYHFSELLFWYLLLFVVWWKVWDRFGDLFFFLIVHN